jgi:2-phospho-L-lactate/phosphoenolpyruvate guanylyltransferase
VNKRPTMLIPAKAFTRGKSRLAGALAPAHRQALCAAMLEDLLERVTVMRGVDVVVVGDEPALVELRRRHAFEHFPEPACTAAGVNAVVLHSARRLAARGVRTACVLPADLPLAAPQDIEWVLARHARRARGDAVTFVPDLRGTGTNIVVSSPPAVFPYSFGEHSLQRHCAIAGRLGIAAGVLEVDSLALDIDTPEDLRLLRELCANEPQRVGARTTALLAKLVTGSSLARSRPAACDLA